ncbi:MAG: hypothetical protein C4522_17900 [Desulfobacteraceae bacterium]|nr:MAG: hypothetical protein C4522_17900 [Desulfobacteraceae bacterium]
MIYIILGVSLIASGISTILRPEYYSSKYDMFFNFSGIEWPYGGILIILGIGFIWTEIRKRRKNL